MTKKLKLYIMLLVTILPVLMAVLIYYFYNAQPKNFERYDLTVTLPYELKRRVNFADESQLGENEIARLNDRNGNMLCSIIQYAAGSELPVENGKSKYDWFAGNSSYIYALDVPENGSTDDYLVLKAYFISKNNLKEYNPEFESNKLAASDRKAELELWQMQINAAKTYLKMFKNNDYDAYIANSVSSLLLNLGIGQATSESGGSTLKICSDIVTFNFDLPSGWNYKYGYYSNTSADTDKVLYNPQYIVVNGTEQIGSIVVGEFDTLPIASGPNSIPDIITTLKISGSPQYEIIDDDGKSGALVLLYDFSGYTISFDEAGTAMPSNELNDYYLILICTDSSAKYLAVEINKNAVTYDGIKEIAKSVTVDTRAA
jgi:hypothetical protein